MRVIEVCPKCGGNIIDSEILTFPPTPKKQCTKCDWTWEGEPEEVLRIPFNPEGYKKLNIPEGKYILKVPIVREIQINS